MLPWWVGPFSPTWIGSLKRRQKQATQWQFHWSQESTKQMICFLYLCCGSGNVVDDWLRRSPFGQLVTLLEHQKWQNDTGLAATQHSDLSQEIEQGLKKKVAHLGSFYFVVDRVWGRVRQGPQLQILLEKKEEKKKTHKTTLKHSCVHSCVNPSKSVFSICLWEK